MNILKNQFTHIMRLISRGKQSNDVMPEPSLQEMTATVEPLETTNEIIATIKPLETTDEIATTVEPLEAIDEIAATTEQLEIIEPVHQNRGRTYNTMIDKTIDLQLYMKRAKKSNYKATKNAGTEIKANNLDVYKDHFVVYRNALNEKYTILVNEAKKYPNPEDYIYQKYFNTNFNHYELDLNDVERRIAYQYEIQMYTIGKISQVKCHDSLFRENPIDSVTIENAKNQFNMRMVNAQIRNILKENRINLDRPCTFTVDPYSYYITVTTDSIELKEQIEMVLNTGENGKNLCRHIKNNALQENTTQVTDNSYLKYQAYHQVLKFTGLKLNELKEQKGAYYTEDGEDIFDLICSAINESMTIPNYYKRQLKAWINNLISDLSSIGWNNIPDMVLKMQYYQ